LAKLDISSKKLPKTGETVMMIVYCLWRSLHPLISKKDSANDLTELKRKLNEHTGTQHKKLMFIQDKMIRGQDKMIRGQDKGPLSLQRKLLGEREYVYSAYSLL